VVIAGATAGARSEIDVRRLFWKQLKIIGSTMASDADVAGMLRMVHGAKLRPSIDRSFPLDEAAEALAYLKSQEQFGKVILEIS
jgi:NADPH:quinone reductase-like Zn-dependent oxidoreductase